MTNDEIADVLDKAHDVLLERGRCHNGLYSEADGSVCARRAIWIASESAGLTFEQELLGPSMAFHRHLRQSGHDDGIVSWNDDPDRTDDDVFDAFRDAAKALREAKG